MHGRMEEKSRQRKPRQSLMQYLDEELRTMRIESLVEVSSVL